MKISRFIFTVILLFSVSKFSNSQPLQLVNAFPNTSFSNPVFLTHSNDATNRIFVVERLGLIKVLPNDSNTNNVKVFLNVTNRINSSGSNERGLLGLAFHPNYDSNGYFYIYYTRAGDNYNCLSRFTRSTTNPDKADSLSEIPLFEVQDPYSNHNGGMLFFGLDGYLYIGMGDGGSAGDPGNRAQNLNEMLGKVHRIDVNGVTAINNYLIPPTNPFANGGGRPEIFTTGMRNPWRMSQDPVTGFIYCGDVGQNAWEEIDILEAGENYGWRCYEGNHAYNTGGCSAFSTYAPPIKEYDHSSSNCSVTGGYVYRGLRRPELTGSYIYGDYCSRSIWKLTYSGGVVSDEALLLSSPSSIYSFGTDQQNELYVCCANNIIYRFNKSDLVGVNNSVSEIPSGFSLEQNYPNPFNPSTNIKYYIPQLSKVKLSIFDAVGNEINTLVNTNQLSGEYNTRWNGKDSYGISVSSGVYFYRLVVSSSNPLTAGDNFSETKRMVLIK